MMMHTNCNTANNKLTLWIFLCLYLLLKLVLPIIPIPPSFISVYLSMLVLTALAFAFARAVAITAYDTRRDALGIILSVLVWGCGFGLGEISKHPLAQRLSGVAQEVGLLFVASISGKLTSLIIREGNLLLPSAITMISIDIWAVNIGRTTPQIAEKASKLFRAATIELPTAGASVMPAPTLLVGFGDIFFTAMLLSAMNRFRLDVRISFWLATIAVALGLTFVAVTNAPVAGLPFIAIGLLLPNFKKFKLTKREWLATASVTIMLWLLLFALWTLLKR
jgi:hypothetical protein